MGLPLCHCTHQPSALTSAQRADSFHFSGPGRGAGIRPGEDGGGAKPGKGQAQAQEKEEATVRMLAEDHSVSAGKEGLQGLGCLRIPEWLGPGVSEEQASFGNSKLSC